MHNHDWKDPAAVEFLGKTDRGVEVWINRRVACADLVVRKGGVVILVSPRTEGFSAPHREIVDVGYPPIDEIRRLVPAGKIRSKVVAVHMAQVSRVARERATVILVTQGISEADVRTVGLEYAATPRQALERAFATVGRSAMVASLRGTAVGTARAPRDGENDGVCRFDVKESSDGRKRT